MNNNYAVWLVALIVVAGAVYYFFMGTPEANAPENMDGVDVVAPTAPPPAPKTGSPAPAPQPKAVTPPPPKPADSSVTTVTYTNNGWSPQTLEIKVGQLVKFVNNSTLTMQIESDPHPTHNSFRELNMSNPVGKGGSYQFIFTKVGIWSYHNEGNPAKGGTIIVKP